MSTRASWAEAWRMASGTVPPWRVMASISARVKRAVTLKRAREFSMGSLS